MIRHYIYWKSIKTPATGYGQCIFNKEVAEYIVKMLDEMYYGEILHYIGSDSEYKLKTN